MVLSKALTLSRPWVLVAGEYFPIQVTVSSKVEDLTNSKLKLRLSSWSEVDLASGSTGELPTQPHKPSLDPSLLQSAYSFGL